MNVFFFFGFDGDDRRCGFGKTGFYPPRIQAAKNNDKSDIRLRCEHPRYDVSTSKRERELTIEDIDTIWGF